MLLKKCAYLRLGGGHPTLLEAGLSAAPAMEGGGHGFAQQMQVFTGICKAIAVALAVRTGKHCRRAAALLRDAVGQLPDAGAVQPRLEVQAADTGTLDFTHISMSSTRKFTFAQGEPKLPSGYVVPEPAAEDTAADDAAASEGEAAADTPADGAAEQAAPEAETSAEADPAPAAQEPAGTGAAN